MLNNYKKIKSSNKKEKYKIYKIKLIKIDFKSIISIYNDTCCT